MISWTISKCDNVPFGVCAFLLYSNVILIYAAHRGSNPNGRWVSTAIDILADNTKRGGQAVTEPTLSQRNGGPVYSVTEPTLHQTGGGGSTPSSRNIAPSGVEYVVDFHTDTVPSITVRNMPSNAAQTHDTTAARAETAPWGTEVTSLSMAEVPPLNYLPNRDFRIKGGNVIFRNGYKTSMARKRHETYITPQDNKPWWQDVFSTANRAHRQQERRHPRENKHAESRNSFVSGQETTRRDNRSSGSNPITRRRSSPVNDQYYRDGIRRHNDPPYVNIQNSPPSDRPLQDMRPSRPRPYDSRPNHNSRWETSEFRGSPADSVARLEPNTDRRGYEFSRHGNRVNVERPYEPTRSRQQEYPRDRSHSETWQNSGRAERLPNGLEMFREVPRRQYEPTKSVDSYAGHNRGYPDARVDTRQDSFNPSRSNQARHSGYSPVEHRPFMEQPRYPDAIPQNQHINTRENPGYYIGSPSSSYTGNPSRTPSVRSEPWLTNTGTDISALHANLHSFMNNIVPADANTINTNQQRVVQPNTGYIVAPQPPSTLNAPHQATNAYDSTGQLAYPLSQVGTFPSTQGTGSITYPSNAANSDMPVSAFHHNQRSLDSGVATQYVPVTSNSISANPLPSQTMYTPIQSQNHQVLPPSSVHTVAVSQSQHRGQYSSIAQWGVPATIIQQANVIPAQNTFYSNVPAQSVIPSNVPAQNTLYRNVPAQNIPHTNVPAQNTRHSNVPISIIPPGPTPTSTGYNSIAQTSMHHGGNFVQQQIPIQSVSNSFIPQHHVNMGSIPLQPVQNPLLTSQYNFNTGSTDYNHVPLQPVQNSVLTYSVKSTGLAPQTQQVHHSGTVGSPHLDAASPHSTVSIKPGTDFVFNILPTQSNVAFQGMVKRHHTV